MSELLILATGGAGTWALRASFLGLVGDRTLPPALDQAFASARHAVLGALVVTAVVGPAGVDGLLVPSPGPLAAVVAMVVAWRTGSMLRTLIAGVLTVAMLGYVWQ
ncbi:MAG: AzlD domain-containing protein [Dehalococcoidia bacterium]